MAAGAESFAELAGSLPIEAGLSTNPGGEAMVPD